MKSRELEFAQLTEALRRSPVALLIGPRQVGKTTLARRLVSSESENYFDLENPVDLARLEEPLTALRDLKGLVVIDEVQHRPELFPTLRYLVDRGLDTTRADSPARFLVLGSASPVALKQASESLTGRIEIVELGGLRIADLESADQLENLWLRGGFPRSYLSSTEEDSLRWRSEYVRNLVSRDLPEFGLGLPSQSIARFLTLVADANGQIWNSADAARSLGVSETTSRRYIEVLGEALLVRSLQPWSENISKRQVKSPKVYVRDSGLLHSLLGIENRADLLRNRRIGGSWEGWIIEQILQAVGGAFQPYFWRTSGGAEIDLFLVGRGMRIGVEVKRSDAPRMTPSMRAALEDLRLNRLWVLNSGDAAYSLAEKVTVMPARQLFDDPKAEFLTPS